MTDFGVETLEIQPNMEPIEGILDDVEVVELEIEQPMIKPTDMTAKLVEDILVDYSTDQYSFATRLQQFINFKDEHGICDVPLDYHLHPG